MYVTNPFNTPPRTVTTQHCLVLQETLRPINPTPPVSTTPKPTSQPHHSTTFIPGYTFIHSIYQYHQYRLYSLPFVPYLYHIQLYHHTYKHTPSNSTPHGPPSYNPITHAASPIPTPSLSHSPSTHSNFPFIPTLPYTTTHTITNPPTPQLRGPQPTTQQ